MAHPYLMPARQRVTAITPERRGVAPHSCAVISVDAPIRANLKKTVTRVLASLTPREERVPRMRFRIGMNTDHTLEEVGRQFSVTRERIRQAFAGEGLAQAEAS